MGETPLPKAWTRHVRSSMLHAISLASTALTLARGRVTTRGLRAELERANHEIALLREELDLKDSRWIRLSPRRRPHFTAIQRMRILQLKAARGWSCEQAAKALMLDEQTLKSWLRRVDEEGEGALVQLTEPVNRFPEFVRYLVRQLKILCPTMGKVRISQMLARAGLHLGASTVGRILRETGPINRDLAMEQVARTRKMKAKYPGELWHVDLTAVPTGGGFWVSWFPYTLPQCWPFCWWVAVVVDHVSRAVVALAVFPSTPQTEEMERVMTMAISQSGQTPRIAVTDQGGQFFNPMWRRHCRGRGIRPRYGAIGKHGSIAVAERFIRAMKQECVTRLVVPLHIGTMRQELGLYASWYNEHRPNQALGGRTPREVQKAVLPANERPRYEPRVRWPNEASCAAPQAPVRGGQGASIMLAVRFVGGRKHLPVVELREAA